MENLLTFLAGWLSSLSGVALGGWLVYRTKRDPYDPMFTGSGKGDAFNIDEDYSFDEVKPTSLSAATAKANDNFIDQFADGLAKKAAREK